MPVKTLIFGRYDNEDVFRVILKNQNDVTAEFLTFGATWHSYKTKSRRGSTIDVIVGPETLSGYINQFKGTPYFFGSTIGRHAGRINCYGANPILKNYSLSQKRGVHLHGGEKGFTKQNWLIKHVSDTDEPSVTFLYKSSHMEAGYPGEVLTEVTYTLLKDNSILIDYRATSNADTLINLTNHSYFNLSGESLISHSLYIDSNQVLEVQPNLIPTGKFFPVADTPFNFIGYSQLDNLESNTTLDDTFIFNESSIKTPKIKFSSRTSGLEMAVYTDQPSVVVFAPKILKFLENPKNSEIDYSNYPAICFETQLPPDSINHPEFPNCLLKKDSIYTQKTRFSFVRFDIV